MIQIYDTLTRNYKNLDQSEEIKIYVCGITASGYAHLGHAFSSITFEVLDRFLTYKNFKVYRVQNFTDVDDKILDKAKFEGGTMESVAKKYILEFFKDMALLNVKEASHYPRATDEIDNIIKFISLLEKKGLVYESNGSVYFRTNKVKKYGKLSRRDLNNNLEGTRIQIDDDKESQSDFALWKYAENEDPGWNSPWGRGRPGWHIECSSMVLNTIGDTVDIHGGGIDLIFPHHENEIAQSESLTNKQFSKLWMHNGMVQLAGEKMSKSLGNLITVREALKIHDPDCIRMWILSSHYRSPLTYSPELVNNYLKPLTRIKEALNPQLTINNAKSTESNLELESFDKAMSADLNTPVALSQLLILAKKINRSNSLNENTTKARENLLLMLSVLGICQNFKYESLVNNQFPDQEIEKLILKRNQYRLSGDYANSDKIRDLLLEKGVKIIDQSNESKWEFI
jgi:cysteinyl-tRNA synthetase